MAFNETWIFAQGGENLQQILEYDGSNNLLYQGHGTPGAQTTDSTWRIRKFTYNGVPLVTNIQFPSGSPAFAFKWSDRATYIYS